VQQRRNSGVEPLRARVEIVKRHTGSL
jgi:hypothetical protein